MWKMVKLEPREADYDDVDPVDIDRLVREILEAPPMTEEQRRDVESELRRRRRGETWTSK